MEDTEYLFRNDQTPEGMLSVSQIQTFMSCPKKWEYSYVEGLTPRVERSYLTIGKLCHKGFESAMWEMWRQPEQTGMGDMMQVGVSSIRTMWEEYMQVTPFLDEEMPEQEQLLDDAISIFAQALREFDPTKYEVVTLQKNGEKIPALELHFWIPCRHSEGLHGYIDSILRDKETGDIWSTDYKFRRSLSDDSEESFNLQNSVYTKACMMMGIQITGTMTWQHVNTPAADPAILKDGKISRAKIKTTWKHYSDFCTAHGQDPTNYAEMEDKLGEIEWYRATKEYRNEDTVERIWDSIIEPISIAVGFAYGNAEFDGNIRNMFPWNCKMCNFQSLCQAELRDYDADYIRIKEYTLKAHRQ